MNDDSFQSPSRGCDFDTCKAILEYIISDNGRYVSFGNHYLKCNFDRSSRAKKAARNKLQYFRTQATEKRNQFKAELDKYGVDYTVDRLIELGSTADRLNELGSPSPATRQERDIPTPGQTTLLPRQISFQGSSTSTSTMMDDGK